MAVRSIIAVRRNELRLYNLRKEALIEKINKEIDYCSGGLPSLSMVIPLTKIDGFDRTPMPKFSEDQVKEFAKIRSRIRELEKRLRRVERFSPPLRK